MRSKDEIKKDAFQTSERYVALYILEVLLDIRDLLDEAKESRGKKS